MSLNKVSEDLYKFLLDNLQDKRLVNDKLYKTGLTFLFSELKSNIQYEKLLKLRYMLIINELKNIKHFFAEENIPFVVLKGVSLAQRLYSKPYNRMFGDIDILVSSKNLFIAIKILEMLGYKSENETDKESVDFFLQQVSRELHFYPFYKSLINSVEITIEVHVDIVSLWMFRTNCQLTDYILSRRKIENGIPMMDEYDTIIFQSMHLIKHYINDLTGGFINGIIENTLNLKGFHEIALLVDKYIDTLDSKKFSDRVIEFGANKEVQVIIMWLMKAYPSLAKVQDLSIFSKKMDCIADHFCEALKKVSIERVLLDNPHKLASEIISILQQDAFTLVCHNNNNSKKHEKELVGNCGYLDGDRDRTGSPFGTHKVYGQIDKEIDYSAKFWLTWDKTYLWFHIITKHSNPVFHQYIDDDMMISDNAQEFIRLFFDTMKRRQGEPYAIAIIIKPKYNSQGEIESFLHKNINGNRGKEIINKTEYISNMIISEDGYNLKIGLKWNLIPLVPRVGVKFYMDVLVGTEELEVTWRNPSYNGWYYVGEYGKIVLK